MEYIYLDTNIIVVLLNKDQRASDIKRALQLLSGIKNIEFVTSAFTFVEAAKSLIHSCGKSPKWVASNIYEVQKNKKIDTFSFSLIPTSIDPKYSLEDFWVDVGQNMNLYNPGWGDAFHCVIMKNNKIGKILSTDGKDDFKIVPGIKLLHPKDVK